MCAVPAHEAKQTTIEFLGRRRKIANQGLIHDGGSDGVGRHLVDEHEAEIGHPREEPGEVDEHVGLDEGALLEREPFPDAGEDQASSRCCGGGQLSDDYSEKRFVQNPALDSVKFYANRPLRPPIPQPEQQNVGLPGREDSYRRG